MPVLQDLPLPPLSLRLPAHDGGHLDAQRRTVIILFPHQRGFSGILTPDPEWLLELASPFGKLKELSIEVQGALGGGQDFFTRAELLAHLDNKPDGIKNARAVFERTVAANVASQTQKARAHASAMKMLARQKDEVEEKRS